MLNTKMRSVFKSDKSSFTFHINGTPRCSATRFALVILSVILTCMYLKEKNVLDNLLNLHKTLSSE